MAAAHALATTLEALDWDVFFGEQLPGDEGWHELLGGREWRREASPSLRLPATWDEYLAARSRNFRDQLRRRDAGIHRRAAWQGFLVGTVCTYYQAGRDPVFDRHSVGFVLMAHSIRSAIAEGAKEYRFGRGRSVQVTLRKRRSGAGNRAADPRSRRGRSPGWGTDRSVGTQRTPLGPLPRPRDSKHPSPSEGFHPIG
jgi:hypothetical protein